MKFDFTPIEVLQYPKGLEGWKLYLVQYENGEGEIVSESKIWFPANFDPKMILYMIFGASLEPR
jgi:hypothetical protein